MNQNTALKKFDDYCLYGVRFHSYGTEFISDGVRVLHDRKNLKLIINDPEAPKFEISGFENSDQMSDFAMCGDFEDSPENDFFRQAGVVLNLKWKYI